MPEALQVSASAIPPACVVCGTTGSLSARAFQKTYTPPWVYIGLLLGILPVAILMIIGNKTHKLTVSFCQACWDRYHKAQVTSRWMSLLCVVLLAASPVLGIATESWIVGLGLLAAAFGVIIYAGRQLTGVSPKCVKLSREAIVLAIPGHGEVDMARAQA
jgi:hypothetical protein